MKEISFWHKETDRFDTGIPARADVVVIGGDLAGMLLASRLAQTGRSVVVLADEVGAGAFGRGTGIVSPHYGLDLYELEREHGRGVARDVLGLRQYVVDELDSEVNLDKISGHAMSHDPHTTLNLRNEHEALNRHGASRTWRDEQEKHIDNSIQECSFYSGDRACNPIDLIHSLADRVEEFGGVVKDRLEKLKYCEDNNSVEVKTDQGTCQAGSVCDLSNSDVLKETLFATDQDSHGDTGEHIWSRNSYPMFDYARRMPDGKWIVGSRRTWSSSNEKNRASHNVLDLSSGLISHKHIKPTHSWQRPFVAYNKQTLPGVKLDGRIIKAHGTGQDDPIMDMIAVDEVLRMYTQKPSTFSKVLSTLPRAESRHGALARMAFRAMLDDRLSRDARLRIV